MTPVKLSQGSVVMLILQSIVRRGCFVSGLPSNLCHSRSSAAAVVTFQLCWILNERWKMTCFPDTCQSHTGFCTNSIAELDKRELTPSSRQRPIYSIKTSWNSLTFSKRSIDQDLKRTRSSKEDVFLCVCLKHSATIYTCKMEIFPFPKIYPATPWCSCTLSCTSDCSAPVWKQPSCIHSVNVRGDMEFLPLCLGCKRRRQRDTRSRPFLLLLWDDFFLFFLFFYF